MLPKGMKRKLLVGRKAVRASVASKGCYILNNDIFVATNLTAKDLKLSNNVGVVALHFPS
jgi:hypothetical protein